jgi:hypothetical protein
MGASLQAPHRVRSWLLGSRRLSGLVCLACWFLAALPVQAQLFDKATVIKNARVETGTGKVLESVDVLIKGGRIAEVNSDIKAPMFASVVDATGMTLTPGLIDPWSAMGRLGSARSGIAASTAWDDFDRYDRDLFREALQQGVTTIFVSPGAGAGIAGRGALVSLAPGTGGSAGELIGDEFSMSIDLGSGLSGVARLTKFAAVRKAFRTAIEYRQAKEDYEEELEEYLEALKKRREEKEKDKAEAGKESDSPKKNGKKGDKAGKKKKGGKPKEGDDPKPEPKPEPKPDSAGASGLASMMPTEGSESPEDLQRRRGKRKDGNNGKKGEGKGKNGDKKDEDEDELKKPEPPKPDRESEALFKALDHEIKVRIRAHRSADILNALELADEFGIDIILVGATDAALVADDIAKAEVPVILGPVDRTMLHENNEFRRHDPRTVSALERAGVKWSLGSGGDSAVSSRFIGMHAQLLAGQNADAGDWVTIATSRAARALGLRRMGRVAPGMRADLVLWGGRPGDPGVSVQRVFVGGKLAYLTKAAGEGS